MRKGSAAIVPLFLAIMILFWFIAFMGGVNDNQEHLNSLVNVKNVEQRLVTAAMMKKIDKMEENTKSAGTLSEVEINQLVSDDMKSMMVSNNIDSVQGSGTSGSGSSHDSGAGTSGSQQNNSGASSNPQTGSSQQSTSSGNSGMGM